MHENMPKTSVHLDLTVRWLSMKKRSMQKLQQQQQHQQYYQCILHTDLSTIVGVLCAQKPKGFTIDLLDYLGSQAQVYITVYMESVAFLIATATLYMAIAFVSTEQFYDLE